MLNLHFYDILTPMDTGSTEDRIISLETRLAYLEDSINKLQAISIEHASEFDHLKAENRAIKSKFGEFEDLLQEMPDKRPPHY